MATVLAIAAHPDDELFGAAYLAKLAAEGNDLYILCTVRVERSAPARSGSSTS